MRARQNSHLCLQAELANGFAIKPRLFRSSGTRQFDLGSLLSVSCSTIVDTKLSHIINAEVIKGLGYFNLLVGVEKGIGELFSFS